MGRFRRGPSRGKPGSVRLSRGGRFGPAAVANVSRVRGPGNVYAAGHTRAANTRRASARLCYSGSARYAADANTHAEADAGFVMSWKLSSVVGLGLVLGILAGRAVQDPDTGTTSWDGLRAAGFAAYLLLWLSLITGVAVHMRYRPGPMAMTWLLETHRIASALSLSFVAGHVTGLIVDPTIAFSPLDVAFGLSSSYRPLQVALGSLSAWLCIAVLGSTAVAGRMPYRWWRNLHYLSFPAYLLALLHGVTSGTDAGAPLSLGIYACTASLLAAMLVARLFGRGWVTAGGTAGPPA